MDEATKRIWKDLKNENKNKTRNEASVKNIKELKKLGFGDDIQKFYKSIKLPQLYQIIDESFCSILMKEAIKTLIKKRFSEFENELPN